MISKSASDGKLLRLEAIRGLAAVYVVLHHTVPHLFVVGGFNFGIALRFGQEAVILFFLLSGFVIHYSYRTGSDKSLRRYYQSRILRIYIPLIIVYLISYLVVSYDAGRLQNIDAKTLLGNVFMLQDWGFAKPNVIVEAYMGNGPLWSLAYEWWFYMAYFPIVNSRFTVRNRDAVVFFVCLMFALVYIVTPHFFVRVVMYFAIWWTGVRLADAYIDGKLSDLRTHFLSIAVLTLITGFLVLNVFLPTVEGFPITFGRHPVLEVRHFAFALFALIVALVLHKTSWRPFDLITRPFLIFAPISYALYIVHVPLARNATYLDFVENAWLRWFGYIAICLVVAFVIEKLIYPPMRSRLSKVSFGKSRPASG